MSFEGFGSLKQNQSSWSPPVQALLYGVEEKQNVSWLNSMMLVELNLFISVEKVYLRSLTFYKRKLILKIPQICIKKKNSKIF